MNRQLDRSTIFSSRENFKSRRCNLENQVEGVEVWKYIWSNLNANSCIKHIKYATYRFHCWSYLSIQLQNWLVKDCSTDTAMSSLQNNRNSKWRPPDNTAVIILNSVMIRSILKFTLFWLRNVNMKAVASLLFKWTEWTGDNQQMKFLSRRYGVLPDSQDLILTVTCTVHF